MTAGIQNITPQQMRDRNQGPPRAVGRRLDSVPPPEQKSIITPQNGNTPVPAYPNYVPGPIPTSVRENGANNNNVRRPREVVGVTPIPWNNNNNRSSSFHNNNNLF